MTQWYYVDPQHQRQGPVAADALAGLFRGGALTLQSLVWREGLSEWKPLGGFAAELGLDAVPAAATPAPAAEPAGGAPKIDGGDDVRPVTGRAVFTAREPSYAQHAPPHASQSEAVAAAAQSAASRETPHAAAHAADASPYAAPRAALGLSPLPRAQHGAHVVYAGFWKRVAASLIDSFAIGIPIAIVLVIVGGLFGNGFGGLENPFNPTETVFSYILSALAFAWFHSSAGLMATPGKLAVGIKVVRSDGEKISFLRGFARYWGYMLSSLLLLIGLIMAAFTERKQALHDLMCDTLVVDKWAFTSEPERQREELGTVTVVVLVLGGLLLGVAVFFLLIGLAALASMTG